MNTTVHAATPATPAMLQAWRGPYGGVPQWGDVEVEQFPAAFAAAMDVQRAQIARIVAQTAPPSFANTIAAMEDSGRALSAVRSYYFVHSSSLNTGPMPQIRQQMAPRLAAFRDEITQNSALFKRIEAVYRQREKSGLSPEQQRLTWLLYHDFVHAGARLGSKNKQAVATINRALASLFARFSQNVQDDEANLFTRIARAEDLAGLPADLRDAAAQAAAARGFSDGWVIANTRSAVEPFLTYASNRALREAVWQKFIRRGDNGTETDNNTLISEILQLRQRRARLLGFASHAHWQLEQEMAKTPQRALALMEQVWQPAIVQVRKDVAAMQAIADAEPDAVTIAPWDYRYYAEKLRRAQYDLDMNEVTPYLQLDKLREGMFWAAGRLYGLYFVPVDDLPVQHPDVRVWRVKRADGSHVGLWYFDPFARPGKESGAWMNAYRVQENYAGAVTPIVSNNANFMKARPGEPVLISWDDAVTLFHEFGHALHGLLSAVAYPSLAGTNVARDFVEFPSQINEHWLATPELLSRFATHFQSGAPMPPELLARIVRASKFNEGFRTVEYLSAALLDMKLHLAGGRKIDPRRFESEALAALNMPAEIVLRHRLPQFSHIFSSDGYSAGYYAYLWADALTADAWEAFGEAGGAWDSTVAQRFAETILSVGNAHDPAQSFRDFRGRDVDPGALMRKRGFAAARSGAMPTSVAADAASRP